MDWLKRAVVVLASVSASCLAAPLLWMLVDVAIGIAFVGTGYKFPDLTNTLAVSVIVTYFVVCAGFIPMAFAIMFSELHHVRQLWVYSAAGVAIALLLSSITIGITSDILIAGAGAGTVYWLIAGRNAGIVQEMRKSRTQTVAATT